VHGKLTNVSRVYMLRTSSEKLESLGAGALVARVGEGGALVARVGEGGALVARVGEGGALVARVGEGGSTAIGEGGCEVAGAYFHSKYSCANDGSTGSQF